MIPKLQRIAASMRRHVHRRDADSPQGTTSLSLLWKIEIDGKPTTLEDMQNYGVLLFIAGLDTVMNGIGHCVVISLAIPELQAQLRANPKMVPEATEELLRSVHVHRPASDSGEGHRVRRRADEGAQSERCYFCPRRISIRKEFANSDSYDLNRENKAAGRVQRRPGIAVPPRARHLARVERRLFSRLLMRSRRSVDPCRSPDTPQATWVAVDQLHLRRLSRRCSLLRNWCAGRGPGPRDRRRRGHHAAGLQIDYPPWGRHLISEACDGAATACCGELRRHLLLEVLHDLRAIEMLGEFLTTNTWPRWTAGDDTGDGRGRRATGRRPYFVEQGRHAANDGERTGRVLEIAPSDVDLLYYVYVVYAGRAECPS